MVVEKKTCLFCRKEFLWSYKGGWRKVYCSQHCAMWSGHYTYDEYVARRARVGTEQPCVMCDTPFVLSIHAMNRVYCSVKCRNLGTRLKRDYNLLPSEYHTMMASQGGKCKMCKSQPLNGNTLHIDHDHVTGKVRGLLCITCNVHLGWYELHKNELYEYLEAKSCP